MSKIFSKQKNPTSQTLKQTGSALVISLVFMLLMMIVGVGAMQSSTMQERMSGNVRDINTAFQAAEAAIRQGERYLDTTSIINITGTNGLYNLCASGDTDSLCAAPDWKNRESAGWVEGTGSTYDDVYHKPGYIIQKYEEEIDDSAGSYELGPIEQLDLYRVTARGFGVSNNSMVVLQTVFRKKN